MSEPRDEPLPEDVAAKAKAPAEAEPDPEKRWLRDTYRRGEVQLTARAVVAGMLIGAVMCLSNLYVVLKTGWSLGVTVTAAILGFGLFALLKTLRLTKRPLGVLENGAVGSVASAAGYMTGGGNMAAIPALLILGGQRPSTGWMLIWFLVIAAMGVFAAIPIKRQLVNVERLPFPTGRATAETIQSMHGQSGSSDKARRLTFAAVFGAVFAFLRDAKASFLPFNIPKGIELPFSWAGHTAAEWTLSIDGSLILMGAGSFMGFRTCWSMLLGALFTYGFLAPAMVEAGAAAGAGYKQIVPATLWPGAAVLLSSGLLAFAFQWRSVGRSFSGLGQIFKRSRGGVIDPVQEVEVPPAWFLAGYMALGPAIVFLMRYLFGIPLWAGLVALPLALVMGIVAARVTGETDITPTKALGPVTQLAYGAMVPGNMPANVMGANVTGGVGLHAADLLTDLKAGYLLGAHPRKQLFAQLFGVVAGSLAVVPAFNLLVPEASVLGSAQFPAPSVQVWAGVSRALTEGLGGLHPMVRTATLVGLLVGVVLALAEKYVPKRYKAYVPSPSGIGIALVVPGANAVAMFTGAAITEIIQRRDPAKADRVVVPTAAGLIAGESLMGILIAVLIALGALKK